MAHDPLQWIRLADAGDPLVGEHEIRLMHAGHHKLCVTRWQGTLHAFASKCPHAGGALSDGYIDVRGQVVCPIHRYKFCIRSGRNTSGEGYFLRTYPVEERPDGLYVGIGRSRLLDFFRK